MPPTRLALRLRHAIELAQRIGEAARHREDLPGLILEHERRALQWVDHPMYGRVCLPNSPMRYEGAAPLDLQPSGELGCDNEAVYCDWLGLSQDEFRQLQAGEVI